MPVAYLNDDSALFEAFQEADQTAEKLVFERFFTPLCLFAERITQHVGQAEDIAAQSLERAWQRRKEIKDLGHLKNFLYRAAKNAAFNNVRADKTYRANHAVIEYLHSNDVDWGDVEEREILRAELLHKIYEEIEQLPDRCGEIFKLLYFEGLSVDEVAERMGLIAQTVRNQKTRAIGFLRTRLLKKNRLDLLLLLYLLLEKC